MPGRLTPHAPGPHLRTMRTNAVRCALALSLVLAFAQLTPMRAHACGGFFCQRVPVVQAGEQIVYAGGEDGTPTMSVRPSSFCTR